MVKKREEISKGLRETSKYLFSHHKPENHHRCYTFTIFGSKLNFCARCTGIYPGIIIGAVQLFYLNISLPLSLIALSGIPTIIEKYFTGVRNYRGYNSLRTLTGVILGIGYINGIHFFLQNPFHLEIILLAVFYGMVAAWLIIQQRQKDKTPN